DDAAQIAQPDLAHDLLHRLQVGLDDGVFEAAARLLADVAAGVDVDSDTGLGRVDHQVAARLQPHLGPERLVDLRLDAVLLEDRVVLGVQLHARQQAGPDPLDQRPDPAAAR